MIQLKNVLMKKGLSIKEFSHVVGLSEFRLGGAMTNPSRLTSEEKRCVEVALLGYRLPIEGIWREAESAPIFRGFKGEEEVDVDVDVQTNAHENKELMMGTTREFLYPEEMEFFQLKRDPFEDPNNPTNVWLGPQQKWLERAVMTTVKGHNILALVGEVGSGKSTILRRFLTRWRKDRKVVVISPDTLRRQSMDEASLSIAICRDLEPGGKIPHNKEARSNKVRKLLERSMDEGLNPVMVIEEAHDLGPDALIGLKRIWDSYNTFKLLAIVMVGQGKPRPPGNTDIDLRWDLGCRLKHDHRIRELGQRTRVEHIHPYDADQVEGFLTWRFARAGGDVTTCFDPSGFAALGGAQGYPLTISNVAVLAMRKAHQLGDTIVTGDHVAAVTN